MTTTTFAVMAARFRGTIDHWDPALLDVLGSQRDVIVFDNRGTAASSGAPPASLFQHADDFGHEVLNFLR